MKKKLFDFLSSRSSRWMAITLAAITGFAAGFIFPLRVSLSLQNDLILPLVGLTAVLWLAWRLREPWDEIVSIAVTLLSFSTVLAALWRMSTHGIYDVFGLLPWFDSAGYYSEALRLLDGGLFTQISARRPVFPALFSTLSLVTGRNLRLSVLIITAIAAFSTWLLARGVRRSEKNALLPAVLTVMLLFYYRKFNGAVLSDTLGFTLGVLYLGFLWNAISRKKLLPALAGLFCLTLGESARPAAVFSIPLLFLWIVFFFRSKENIWKKAGFASVAVIAGFVVNTILTSVLAPGISASYSNFANLIYSLVNGGTGWHAVYVDHPEFFAPGNEGYAAQQIYNISWQIFLSNPMNTVTACWRSVTALFSAAPYSAFNYFDSASTPREITLAGAPLEFILRWIANILLIALLPLGIIFRRNSKLTLLLALNLGVLISLPFAAPWEVENMRAYAVSIAGMALAVCYVVVFVITTPGKTSVEHPVDTPRAEFILTGLLVTGILVVPLLIRLFARVPAVPTIACPAGQEKFVTRISAGSAIYVGKTAVDPYSIPFERYLKNLDQFPDATIGQELKKIPEGYVISQQNDALHEGNAFWMIGPADLMRPTGTQLVYCGDFKAMSENSKYFLVSGTAN